MDPEITQKIERAKQELEQMIDLNPQVMLLVNREGIIQRANAALLKLMGKDNFDDILWKRLGDVFPGTEDLGKVGHTTVEGTSREIDMELAGRGTRTLKFTVVGGVRSSELSAVIVDDITDEKKKEAGLEEKYKKEAVDAIAGALMHNVNQSLTVIMAETHLLQVALEQGSSDQKEYGGSLEGILNHTTKIAEILQKVQNAKRLVTEQYIDDIHIMDLEKSQVAEPAGASLSPRIEQEQNVSREVLETLMAALDTHEVTACDHARRTSEFAAIMARELKLGEFGMKSIRQCARFHDIGKIGIPDGILQKPGKLTDEEMEIMKRHSLIGYGLLKAVPGMDVEAQASRYHHEKFDGSGYPERIAGEMIPIAARIISVVDAFDVLRAGRAYSPPKSLDVTVRIIQEDCGSHFDPQVVDAFMRCYEEMNARFPEISENE